MKDHEFRLAKDIANLLGLLWALSQSHLYCQMVSQYRPCFQRWYSKSLWLSYHLTMQSKKKKSEIISAVWKIINAVQKSYEVIGSDVFGTWFSCYDNVVQFRWFCDFKQNLKSENAENIFLFKSFFFLVVYLVSLVMHYIAVNSDSCSYLLEGCSENNIKPIFLTTNPKTFLTCILSLLIQKCWS